MARRSFTSVADDLELVDDLLASALDDLPSQSVSKSPITTARIIVARAIARVSGRQPVAKPRKGKAGQPPEPTAT